MRATLTGTVIYKTDPDARQTTALYQYNDNTYSSVMPDFLANDTPVRRHVPRQLRRKLLAVPLDGGEVLGNFWPNNMLGVPNTMTATSTVCLTAKRRPLPPGMRLDLKTGASENGTFPSKLRCTRRGRRHCHKPHRFGLSFHSVRFEMLSAILQNSTYEFDLTDLPRGAYPKDF